VEKTNAFPTTTGSWSSYNMSLQPDYCNEAAVKIAFELAGVASGIRASIANVLHDTSGCVPLTVSFQDTIHLGKKYIWDFGDGSPRQTTTKDSISHTYTFIGDFQVMLISIDSSTCNIADTSYTHIRVRADKADLGFTYVKLLPCNSLNYEFTNTSVPPVNKPFGPQSFTWDFGDGSQLVSNAITLQHSYAASGIYNVVLHLNDTAYCNAPDSVVKQIRIAVNVKAQFETPPSGCAPYNALFNNTTAGGQQFFWDFGDGSTSTDINPTHLYNVGNYTIKLIAYDNSTCNKIDSTTFSIIVSPKPLAAFTATPQPPKENIPISFTNNSTGGVLYKWDFGDGDTLMTKRIDTTIEHIYNKTGTYHACLVAYNEYGCTDTTCKDIDAIVIPLVDVPNAFTPNGDGINDLVRVRGYGIDKMSWLIYNRWGRLVFQSASLNEGWNGYYKGTLQPQDVYVYVLDVSFTDGTKYIKKGDITLLR